MHSRHISSLQALRITDGHRGGKQGGLFNFFFSDHIWRLMVKISSNIQKHPLSLSSMHLLFQSFGSASCVFVHNRGVCVTGCYLCVCISSNLIEQSLRRRSPGRLSSPRALEQEKVGWGMRTLIPVGGQKASGGAQFEGEQRVRRFQG